MSDYAQQLTAKRKQSIFSIFIRKRSLTMFILFIIILTIFSIASNGLMLDRRNLMNIINMMAVSAFLAAGVAVLMISGRLDLSTGANGTLCGIFLAYILRAGMPLVPSLILTLILGLFVGYINGVLVNELNMAPFIATLATSSIATGFVIMIGQRRIIPVLHPFLMGYGSHMLFGYVPVSALFAFALMAILGIILHKTKFGRQIYIVGGNPQAAKLSGINPKKMSYVLFMICGLFASIAGITLVSRLQSANMQGLVAQRFQGIIAAVLGGISFGGGTGGMGGTFIGLLVLNTFTNGMTVTGIGAYWQHVASGALLIFALTLEYFQGKQSQKVLA